MNWTHPSLYRAPTYSVTDKYVLKGSTIIAYLQPDDLRGVLYVARAAKAKELIGTATSPAEAMLMAIRDHEGAARV